MENYFDLSQPSNKVVCPQKLRYVVAIKLSEDFIEQLENGKDLSIKFGEKNQIMIDGTVHSFNSYSEQNPHECYVKSNQIFRKIGPIIKKVNVNQALGEKDRNKIKANTKLIEENKRAHQTKHMDNINGKTKHRLPTRKKEVRNRTPRTEKLKRTKSSSSLKSVPTKLLSPQHTLINHKPPSRSHRDTIKPLGKKSASGEISSAVVPKTKPVKKELSREELTEKIIHLLAVEPLKLYKIQAKLTSFSTLIKEILHVVSDETTQGYDLKDEYFDQVNLNYAHYKPADKAKVLARRKERKKGKPPGGDIKSMEEFEKCKKDFEAKYPQYKDLHAKVRREIEYFRQLGKILEKREDPMTQKAAAKDIEDHYKENHERVTEMKHKCESLHFELAALKERINRFQKKNNVK